MPPRHQDTRDDARWFSLDDDQRPQLLALLPRERATEQPTTQTGHTWKDLGSVVEPFVTMAHRRRDASGKDL